MLKENQKDVKSETAETNGVKSDDVFSWLLLDSDSTSFMDSLHKDFLLEDSKVAETNGHDKKKKRTLAQTSILPAPPPIMGFPPIRHPSAMNLTPSPQTNEASQLKKQKLEASKKERNRISAKQCRLRKKEQVLDLQKRVAELEKRNLDLSLKLQEATTEKKREHEEKLEITAQLQKMVENKSSNEEISNVIVSFADLYADYGRNRTKALRFHMSQVRRFMVPTQVTKMALWILQQDEKFYTDHDTLGDGSETFWGILSKEMELSEAQKQKILTFRPFFQQLGKDLDECAQSIAEVEKKLELKNLKIEQAIHKLTTVISPRQAAQFINWVTKNQACIHMLNKLWRTE